MTGKSHLFQLLTQNYAAMTDEQLAHPDPSEHEVALRQRAGAHNWLRQQGIPRTIERAEYSFSDIDIMSRALKFSSSFKIDERITQSLLHTDSDLTIKHLPYASTYIDAEFTYDGLLVSGLLLWDPLSKDNPRIGFWDPSHLQPQRVELFEKQGYLVFFPLIDPKTSSALLCSLSVSDWTKNAALITDDDGVLAKTYRDHRFRKGLLMFTQAFLRFLYNPEVEILKREYSAVRKKRRWQQGRPVEDHHYLRVTGKTRVFLNEFDSEKFSGEFLRRTESWIVRGHFRTFKSKVFTNLKGSEIWIAPHVKGFGQPVSRNYIVSDKKVVWQNQLLMETLVRDLFPSHLVLSNTRGFLDGLEIDCYIPDLKLGFEYDGKQHFEHVPVFHRDEDAFAGQQKRDKEKDQLCRERGIQLIRIRYDETLTRELLTAKLEAAGFWS